MVLLLLLLLCCVKCEQLILVGSGWDCPMRERRRVPRANKLAAVREYSVHLSGFVSLRLCVFLFPFSFFLFPFSSFLSFFLSFSLILALSLPFSLETEVPLPVSDWPVCQQGSRLPFAARPDTPTTWPRASCWPAVALHAELQDGLVILQCAHQPPTPAANGPMVPANALHLTESDSLHSAAVVF